MNDRRSPFTAVSNAAPYAERHDGGRISGLDHFLMKTTGTVLGNLRVGYRAAGSLADRVLARTLELVDLDGDDWQRALEVARLRLSAESMSDAAIVEAFALATEATRRIFGFRHHRVQIIGALMLLRGRLVEMETGEGKTITALLAAAAAGLSGAPVHVVTVNDYLAARDCAELRPVYSLLGLSVGLVTSDDEPDQRRLAYQCDVTYCTNKDLVFDYLRDRLAIGQRRGRARRLVRDLAGGAGPDVPLLLRGLYFAIVDEADSVLIDEARTPLILSATIDGGDPAVFRALALEIAAMLTETVDFRVTRQSRGVQLLDGADAHIAALLKDRAAPDLSTRLRHEMVVQALTALHLYRRDIDYIVQDGKIQIVDEYTGRVMPDRAWENGLHQMIEAKEQCDSTGGRQTIARITYQRFFRRYLRLSGMTGTIAESAGEINASFGLRTFRVPTNFPLRRRDDGSTLLPTQTQKWQAVAQSALSQRNNGRPVLIGTRSVGASEALSAVLAAQGVDHLVLNARQDSNEAEIVASAGLPGRITVATNMAGRGTDIKLAQATRIAGGLHVILTEFHESARIDRQLFGRSARQGDPGSYEMIVALDDEIFRKFCPQAAVIGGKVLTALPRPSWSGALSRMLRSYGQATADRYNSAVRLQTVRQDLENDTNLSFAGRQE